MTDSDDNPKLQSTTYYQIGDDEYLAVFVDENGEKSQFTVDREQMLGLAHGVVLTLDADEEEIML